MKQKMKLFNRNFSEITNLLIILAIVFVGLSILDPKNFLSVNNFVSMMYQMGEFGLFTLGMLVVMLIGGINLSIIASAAFTGIIIGVIFKKLIVPGMSGTTIFLIILLAVIVALAVSLIIGLINGLLVGFLGISSILVTLGVMTLLQGTSVVITKAGGVSDFPDMFLTIANSKLLGIPMPFILFIISIAFTAIYLNKTSTGFSIYMIGSNEKVTRYSGINNRIVILKTFLISGFLSGIGSIIMTARFNSARSDYGGSYLLQTILVILLGGVSASGGAGTVAGVVIAIIILQFLSTGFNILGFSTFLTTAIWGFMLILAIFMNYYRSKFTKALTIKNLGKNGLSSVKK
jgi:simple sugar transport system permease protein